jgi:hypothetical protein
LLPAESGGRRSKSKSKRKIRKRIKMKSKSRRRIFYRPQPCELANGP